MVPGPIEHAHSQIVAFFEMKGKYTSQLPEALHSRNFEASHCTNGMRVRVPEHDLVGIFRTRWRVDGAHPVIEELCVSERGRFLPLKHQTIGVGLGDADLDTGER